MTENIDKFQSSMNQGHSAAWDQDWKKAAEFYRQALEISADHPSALNSLGLALFELEEFDKALKVYQRTIEITPEDPIPMDKIARIEERQGKLPEAIRSFLKAAELYVKNREIDKAIDCWSRIITLKPDHLNARTRLAMINERRGKKSEAVDEYLATASILQHQGEVQRSIQVVEYCLQLVPEHQNAKNALVLLHSNQMLPKPIRPRGGTGPMRMAQVKKMQEPQDEESGSKNPIDETRDKALTRMASLLFDQAEIASEERPTQRRELSAFTRGSGTQGRQQVKDSRALLYLGQAIDAQTRSDNNQTLAELEKALDAGLDHPAVNFLVGWIYSKNQSKKLIKHLQKAFKHPDYALGSYLLMGSYYFSLENYGDAAISYLNALAIADSASVPSSKAATIRQLYEPIIEAQSHQENAESLKKLCKNIEEHLNRANWLRHLSALRQQLPKTADGDYQPLADLLLSSSSFVVDAMSRIKELSAQKKYYSAVEEAFNTLDKAPTFLPLHILIGEFLLQQGKSQEAVNKFSLVARLYNLRGEAIQGIQMLERVTKMAPMNLKIREELVDMLIDQTQVLPAAEQLKEIADIYYQLADLEKAHQTYTEAIRLIQQSKSNRYLLLEMLYRKADIDVQRLDLRQAVQIFEQIKAIEPHDLKARNKLVDLYFKLGQDSPAISELDSFIKVLDSSGQQQKIIQFLQELAAEIPDKLEIRKRLADQYIKTGNKSEAVEQLDMIAEALLNMKNREGALLVLRTIIALKPDNAAEYQRAYEQLSRQSS